MLKILPVFITALVLTFCNVVGADAVVQTETVAALSGDLFDQDSGTFELFDDQFFSLTANPFDPSLGTLVSATVSFTDFSVSGLGTALEQNAATSINISGPYTIGGATFDGAGVNDSQISSVAGELLEFNLTLDDITQTFFVADDGLPFGDPNLVGEAFDPVILDAITGSVPFDVQFNSAGPITLTNVIDVEAEASATISIQYHFEPTAIPEPSSAVVAMPGLMAMAVRRRRGR